MNLTVNDVQEAWDFLTNVVYNNNDGEFRIHTNRSGLRLYMSFSDKQYTGVQIDYVQRANSSNTKRYIHRDDYDVVASTYTDSLIGTDLVDVLNKHMEQFPGAELSGMGIDFEDNIKYRWSEEWTGTLDDFRKLSRRR